MAATRCRRRRAPNGHIGERQRELPVGNVEDRRRRSDRGRAAARRRRCRRSSIQGALASFSKRRRLPIASRRRASISAPSTALAMPTPASFAPSASVNVRPEMSGMPMRREESAGNRAEVGSGLIGAIRRRPAFDEERAAGVAAAQRPGEPDADRLEAGPARQRFEQASVGRALRLLGRVARRRQRQAEHGHVLGPHAGIDLPQPEEAVQQQPRAGSSTSVSAISPTTSAARPRARHELPRSPPCFMAWPCLSARPEARG